MKASSIQHDSSEVPPLDTKGKVTPVKGRISMSYFKCPDCGSVHHIFGDSKVDAEAEKYGIKAIAKLPIDPVIATMAKNGVGEPAAWDVSKFVSWYNSRK